jgi:hypothetical protein
VAVIGIGETEYYRHRSSPDPEFKLALKAILSARKEAGLDPREIDGFASYGDDRSAASRLAAALGTHRLRTPRCGGARRRWLLRRGRQCRRFHRRRSAVARTPDDGPFVNLGTEPQRAHQRDHEPSDDSGEPEQCVDHGRLHEVECYTGDGVLRVLDRRSRCGGRFNGTFAVSKTLDICIIQHSRSK